MTLPTQITINPLPGSNAAEPNLSPYQSRLVRAPDIVNDNFFASFKDVLDIINPLQHIPIVATLYRQFTGSSISDGARIAGDTLFGGPAGLFVSVINSITQEMTGKDIGANVFSMVTDKYGKAAKLNLES